MLCHDQSSSVSHFSRLAFKTLRVRDAGTKPTEHWPTLPIASERITRNAAAPRKAARVANATESGCTRRAGRHAWRQSRGCQSRGVKQSASCEMHRHRATQKKTARKQHATQSNRSRAQASTTAHTDWKWTSKWHSSNPLFFCAFYTASEQRVSGALFRRLNPSFRIKYPCRKSE